MRRRGGALLLMLAHCGMSHADGSGVAGRLQTNATEGAFIYRHICQGCHLPGGVGAIGAGVYPKLAGNPALVSWQYVALTLLNGRANMPGFGVPVGQAIAPRTALLSDAQIAAVTNYVRGSFGNHYGGRVSAAQVQQLPHPASSAHP